MLVPICIPLSNLLPPAGPHCSDLSAPRYSSSVLGFTSSMFRSMSNMFSGLRLKVAEIWSKVFPRVSGTRRKVNSKKNKRSAAKMRKTYGPQRFYSIWKCKIVYSKLIQCSALICLICLICICTYGNILESHANNKVRCPVGTSSHSHGCRSGPLRKQLGHEKPRNGSWSHLKEGHKAKDGQHADVAHPWHAFLLIEKNYRKV